MDRIGTDFFLVIKHIIDWLVCKLGAFENYRYKEDLYPSSWFRIAYDWLRSNLPLVTDILVKSNKLESYDMLLEKVACHG